MRFSRFARPNLDLGVIDDEAWAQEDDHLEQAMRPAMMTRDAQLWVVSAAGTEKSACEIRAIP